MQGAMNMIQQLETYQLENRPSQQELADKLDAGAAATFDQNLIEKL